MHTFLRIITTSYALLYYKSSLKSSTYAGFVSVKQALINPASYSHVIFGEETCYSSSPNELWELKKENNLYDLDSIFDLYDRKREMDAAIKNGTSIIWIATEDKYVNFFGYRSLFDGYLHNLGKELFKKCSIYQKHSYKMNILKGSPFYKYFENLAETGWYLCWDKYEGYASLANTPENYSLGAKMEVNGKIAWMLSPPTTDEGVTTLINCAIEQEVIYETSIYEGIFLSHNSEDKPFVRYLEEMLVEHGVNNVWVDEAEILIGDSLLQKISEGITKTTYFGIILSKNSVKSAWVNKELEIALPHEIGQKSVKVLPILIESCEIPPFLINKLYADFTSKEKYEESLKKILRRLRK